MNNILIPFANSIDPMSGGVERVYHNIVPFLYHMDIKFMQPIT